MTNRRAPRLRSLLASVLIGGTLVPLSATPAFAANDLGSISGRVGNPGALLPTDPGWAKVCVSAFDLAGNEIKTTVTQDNGGPTDPQSIDRGLYSIEGLRQGSYKVRFIDCGDNNVGGSGNPALETLWSGNASSFDTATTVVVNADQASGDFTSPTLNVELGDDATLSGTVQEDFPSGTLLAGVCVTIYDATTGAPVAEVVSQSGVGAGNFTVTGLRAGSYKVGFSDSEPSCGSYRRTTGTVGVVGVPASESLMGDPVSESVTSPNTAGANADESHAAEFYRNCTTLSCPTIQSFTLATNDNQSEINAELARILPTRGIQGVISSDSGGGAGGICVSAYDSSNGDHKATRLTNATGAYTIANLPLGSYAIEAHERCVNNIAITDDLYVAEFADGVAPSDDLAPISIVRTGSLPAGVASTTVTTGTFATRSFSIARRGTISGKVTDESTPPKNLQDVCVVALDGAGAKTLPAPSAVSLFDGTYSITNLRPATYKIEFRATDAAGDECGPNAHAADDNDSNTSNGYLSEFYNGVTAKAQATAVPLGSGGSIGNIGASLRSDNVVRSITGTVTREGTSPAAPIANVCVIALDLDGKQVDAALTLANGTYDINQVPEGQYKVKFTTTQACDTNKDGTPERAAETNPSSAQYLGTEFYNNVTTVGQGSTVTVGATGASNIHGVLAQGTLISGPLTGLNGSDLACVELLDTAQRVLQSVERSNGTFTFHGVPAGRHFVRADDKQPNGTCDGKPFVDPADDYRTEYYSEVRTFNEATPIDLTAGGSRTNIALTMDRTNSVGNFGSVYGFVFDPDLDGDGNNDGCFLGSCSDDERPLSNIRVDMFGITQNPVTDTPIGTAVTNDAGRWEITSKPAGTYKFRFTDPTGIHATEWHRGRPAFENANGVALAEGAIDVEVAERTISTADNTDPDRATVLLRAGSISGRVSSVTTGSGVSGASVELLTGSGEELVTVVKTDSQGRYTIGGVAPAQYKVHFVPNQATLGDQYYNQRDTYATADLITVNPTTSTSAINGSLPANTAPKPADDEVQAEINKTTNLPGLLGNDADAEGDSLTIVSVTQPTPHGTVTIKENGTVDFTGGEDKQDDATFTYTVKDPSGLTGTATVKVEMVGQIIGAPPVAVDDEVTADRNETITINVMANDSDPDGNRNDLIIQSVGTPFHGRAVITGQSIRYTPDTDFVGTDQFAYTIKDVQGFTSSARVTVRIAAATESSANAPVAAGGTVGTQGGSASSTNLIITTVTSPNAGNITIEETNGPSSTSNGLTTISPRVDITAPNASASNPLVITFRIDGSVLQGEQPQRAIRVLRNGAGLADCLGARIASPDPCIAGHQMIGDDVFLTILASRASTWTFGFLDEAVVDRAAVQGAGRVDTAVRVARQAFSPDEVDTVVIARSDTYPDALAGAPLAHSVGGPLLLTNRSALDAVTRDEILRLGVRRVIILGGTNAVSTGVENTLRNLQGVQTVERIFGPDRYQTAAEVAKRLPAYNAAYVVEGQNDQATRGWPDAVSVASLAAYQGRPIFLVTRDALPSATRNALSGLASVAVVGGPGAVSQAVLNQIDQVAGSVSRIAGNSRYETNYEVALVARNAGMSVSSIWIATGTNFPDALAAGAAVAKEGGILLLVNGQNYADSPRVSQMLKQFRTQIESVTIAGGTAAVSSSVESRIRQDTVT